MTQPLTADRANQIRSMEPADSTPEQIGQAITDLWQEIERLRGMLTDREDGIRKLIALENAGVDNWGGYSDAMASLEG